MTEPFFDYGLENRIKDHLVEHDLIAERLEEQGPLVVDRLCNQEHWPTSLRQLARDAGYSATYLSQVRRGNLVISMRLFSLLSRFLQDRTRHERLTARPKNRTKAGSCRGRKDLRK